MDRQKPSKNPVENANPNEKRPQNLKNGSTGV
jgi:hypothetical protein